MKKLMITALLVLGSFTVQAQDVDWRLVGGVNFSYVEETPQLLDATSAFGYTLGIAADIGSHLFLQPSLQYASHGSSVTIPSATDGDTKHSIRVNYIRVPVQAGLRLFEGGSAIPFNIEGRAGLSQSFRVGFSDRVKSGTGAALTSDDIAGMRTAGVVGAGVRLLFFSLDVEYEFGLTDLFVNNGPTKLDALYVIFGGNF
jgi:hypothetical protein